ncbi:MAG: nitroreductase family protein [Acidimicrobiia bacterium]|nr:nitroreductase family protein [Acidimicrobiia bacterium]
MDVLEAIRARRAVRAFLPNELAKEAVEELLLLATYAPSALNRQPWSFLVLTGRDRLAGLEDAVRASCLAAVERSAGDEPSEIVQHVRDLVAARFPIFHGAPAAVVVLVPAGDRTAVVDGALAAQNLMLAAHAHGLATCPVGLAAPYFQDPANLATLGVPADRYAALVLALGEPDGPPPAMPERRAPTVHWT